MRSYQSLLLALTSIQLILYVSGEFDISSNKFCQSINTLELISGFHSSQYWFKTDKFNDPSKDLIFYHDNSTSVIIKYKACLLSNIACNCAFVLRVKEGENYKYAFVDVCYKDLKLNAKSNNVELTYVENDSVTSSFQLECHNFNNDWSLLPTELDTFQCAKLNDTTYMVRTVNTNNNVYVRFTVKIDENHSRDSLEEIALTIEDPEKDVIRDDLCGSYNEIQPTTSSKATTTLSNIESNQINRILQFEGHLINVIDKNLDWNFDLKKFSIESCDFQNENMYIYTFMGKRLRKTDAFKAYKDYILYNDNNRIKVTGKFKKCHESDQNDRDADSSVMCNCALTLEVTDQSSPRYVFVDGCNANLDLNMKFKYLDRKNKEALESGNFPIVDCDDQFINDVNNQTQWNVLTKRFDYFKCARLVNNKQSENKCKTYLIEAIYQDRNVRLQVDIDCEGKNSYLYNIKLISSLQIGSSTSGLCGRINDQISSCSLFTSNQFICDVTVNDLADYWNIENELFKAKWELDLTSFTNKYECDVYNYNKRIKQFNNEGLLKTNYLTQVSSPLVLYDHNQEIMVISKYRICLKSSRLQYCACSLYIRVNNDDPEYIFIDFCQAQVLMSSESPLLKFKHYKVNPIFNDDFPCNYTIVDENNEQEWSQVPVNFGYFKCAKLKSECNSYIIRTFNTDHNIKVQADTGCPNEVMDFLSDIKIKPALKAENFSRGLCGYWSKNDVPSDYFVQSSAQDDNFNSNLKLIEDNIYSNSVEYYIENGLLRYDTILDFFHNNTPAENSTILSSKFCKVYNDPHVSGFSGKEYEFQFEGSYVLYQIKDVMVIGKFKKVAGCGAQGVACICGAVIVTDIKSKDGYRKWVEIDSCGSDLKVELNLQEKLELKENCVTVTDEALKMSEADIFNNFRWYETYKKARPFQTWRYDCFKVRSGDFYIYNIMLKFDRLVEMDEKYSQTLVRVYEHVDKNLINSIKIHPSKHAYSYDDSDYGKSGGVCGTTLIDYYSLPLWHSIPNEWEDPIRVNPSQNFVNYWEANTAIRREMPKHSKDSEETDVKKYEIAKRDLMLLEKFYQNDSKKISANEASEKCNAKLNNQDITLNEEFEKERENLIQICITDLTMTNDEMWVGIHWSSLQQKFIDLLLSDKKNFGPDNLLKDEILKLYKIDCQNGCSGSEKGKCFKNPLCVYGKECTYLVLCDCFKPYGSSDCSVNLESPPEFELVEKCCDTRTMNCDKIEGIGPKFSNNNTLYYKMRIVVDSVELYSIVDIVDHVQNDGFEINYPFGLISEIEKSTVTIILGVSYTQDKYSWQNLTFYDSDCRQCNEGVLDNSLVEGTCITKNSKVCSTLIDGKCDEANPCSSVFDLGLLVQSSNKATDEQFTLIKKGLSEVVGRLKVAQNQVHVGFLQYAQRTDTISTVRTSQQSSSEYLIGRIQDLFYIPHEFSYVRDALQKCSNEIFSVNRSFIAPKVALLINDASSSPKVDLTAAVNQLRNKNIEVIVVAIGNSVDMNELKQIVNGNEDQIVHLQNYADIYDNIHDIKQKACSINAPLKLDQTEFFKMGNDDYRYFKADLKGIKSDLIEIQVNNSNNGKSSLFYSFSIKNPLEHNSDGRFENKIEKYDPLTETTTSIYFVFVPDNAEQIFITLKNVDRPTELNIRIYESEF